MEFLYLKWQWYLPRKWKVGVMKLVSTGTRQRGWCCVGSLKWKLNPQDAISRERNTWPGRLRRNGQHLLQHHRPGTPGDGSCISRRPRLTRSLEDARYVHINFRLLADLVEFERVKKIYAFIFFITGVCIFPWWIFWSPVVAQCHFNANYLVLPIQSTEYFSQPFQYLN